MAGWKVYVGHWRARREEVEEMKEKLGGACLRVGKKRGEEGRKGNGEGKENGKRKEEEEMRIGGEEGEGLSSLKL